jgi:hypothetical protein
MSDNDNAARGGESAAPEFFADNVELDRLERVRRFADAVGIHHRVGETGITPSGSSGEAAHLSRAVYCASADEALRLKAALMRDRLTAPDPHRPESVAGEREARAG